MIVRAPRPEINFTICHNATIRDKRLSWKARGLLVWLLSMPDNWTASADNLADEGPDGRDAVQSGLRELEETGYLVRRRRRNAKGQWEHDSFVHDLPQSPEPENPVTASPAETQETPAQTANGFSRAGKPRDKEEPIEEETIKEELSTSSPSVFSTRKPSKTSSTANAAFEEAWKLYPRKIAKAAALKAWRARVREGVPVEVLTDCVMQYALSVSVNRVEQRYVLHGATFFGPNERWKDYLVTSDHPQANAEVVKKADSSNDPGFWDQLRDEMGGE